MKIFFVLISAAGLRARRVLLSLGYSRMELAIPSCIFMATMCMESMDNVLGEQLLRERELDNVVNPDIYKPQVSGAYKSMVDRYTIA